ncbi:uncharacterized protein SAPINGB_P002938 [Magnusiomyces paraingens]|uniref:Cytochrome c oxidase assembly protein COX11 n=1 Tax=Magnusiomyces paraingens TaxID=2606893 RepID=A0A5E8BJA0_9ASCO|nr:uncharacterized protein SAPINGB_P002938 [Saprochaete ingens]VVT50962.1 unnamed protein product [Saprochaete ingens]
MLTKPLIPRPTTGLLPRTTNHFFTRPSRSTFQFRLASSVPPKQQPPRITREQYEEISSRIRDERTRKGVRTAGYYTASVIVLFLTLSYAAVPLYRIVCQQSGFSGAPVSADKNFSPEKLIPVDYKRRIRVSFSGNTSTTMPWTFTPQQREVRVLPGETALAFYKARNPTDQDIIGMATYSVVPEKAAPYFNKIQCFCFEEQKLAPGEEVDMPVFFFIDPDIVSDPLMRNVDDIILNYTFFKARYDEEGVLIPLPGDKRVGAIITESYSAPEPKEKPKENPQPMV